MVLTVGCTYTDAATGSGVFTIEYTVNLGRSSGSPVSVPWDLTESSGSFTTDLCISNPGPLHVSITLKDGLDRTSNTLSGDLGLD
jgi:hypothetical protein